MSTKPVKIDPKRRSAVERELNPALATRFQQLRRLLDEGTQTTLRRLWNVGKLIRELTDNEIKYGPRPVERLSVVLGHSVDHLYQASRFFRVFAEEKLRELMDYRTSTGDILSWMHVQRLLVVTDVKARDRIQQQWASQGLTLEQFMACIDKALGRTSSERHKGGRKVQIPSTTDKKVESVCKMGNLFSRNVDAIYCHAEHGIFESVVAMPADKITVGLVGQLEGAQQDLQKLREKVAAAEDNMARAIVAARGKLAAQAQLNAARDVDVLTGRQPKQLPAKKKH